MPAIEHAIQFEAASHLRRHDVVKSGLRWAKANPDQFSDRVHTFNRVTTAINRIIERDERDGKKEFFGLQSFGDVPPSLEETVEFADMMDEGDEYPLDMVHEALAAVGTSLQANKASKYASTRPHVAISELLLDGYSQFAFSFSSHPNANEVYKTAFLKTLAYEHPESALFDDMLEGMRRDYMKEGQLPTAFLNKAFQIRTPAYKVVQEMRQMPRPIAVDFNNVLADSSGEMVNPQAYPMVDSLRKVGNIFVVTTGDYWDGVQESLERGGLWHPDMVLMTASNYEFTAEDDSPHRQRLQKEYDALLGIPPTQERFMGTVGMKLIAPLFGKPWRVPMIDDSRSSTDNNPQMFGLQVQHWSPKFSEYEQKLESRKLSLQDATQQVIALYTTINK